MTTLQQIQTERGEYTKARKKKFLYLKRMGQLSNYYKSKIKIVKKPKTETKEEIKLNWLGKLILFIKIFFKWKKA